MNVGDDYKVKGDNKNTTQVIFKELKLSLTIFALPGKLVYTLLNACSTCPINGIGIRQLEIVKQYVCFI